MTKYISVPASWAMYKVPDETFQLLANGTMALPTQVVLEVMVMNGEAESAGTVGTMVVAEGTEEEDTEEDELPEDGSPFDEDTE